jgi:hypothetical protein
MSQEHPKGTKTQLALALAKRVPAARCARANEVPKNTAYHWARDPQMCGDRKVSSSSVAFHFVELV